MFGKLRAALERIAAGVEASANRPSTDPEAVVQAHVAALETRFSAAVAGLEQRYAVSLAALEARVVAAESRHLTPSPDVLQRLGALEVEFPKLMARHNSLHGKVYREFPERKEREGGAALAPSMGTGVGLYG